MHHHGLLLLTGRVDVERAEPLRQVEVYLRGAALPVAADGVAQHVFEFRPIKCAFARIDAVLMRLPERAAILSRTERSTPSA